MNSFNFRVGLMFTLACLFTICASAQVAPDLTIPTTPAGFFEAARVEWVYGLVVLFGGYLSKWIPGLNAISSGVFRVLTWAIITGAGALYFGADIISVAMTYFMSTSLYEVFLKWIIKSPKPDSQ